MDSSCPFLLGIVHEVAFGDSMQATHNSSLDQTHRPIDVMIFDPWNQDLLTFFHKVVLDRPDVLYVADILIKPRVNGHVLGSHSKPLTMLVLIFNV